MLVFLLVLVGLALILEAVSLNEGLKFIHCELRLSSRTAEPGEIFTIRWKADNASRMPVSFLKIRTHMPGSVSFPDGDVKLVSTGSTRIGEEILRIWGRRSVLRERRAVITKRGPHNFYHSDLFRGDFLGISLKDRAEDYDQSILIYPKPLESEAVKDILGAWCGDMIAERHLIRDPIVPLGVHEYTGREPMHEISWSQSARHGELMVREYDFTRNYSCAVVMSAGGISLTEEDKMDRLCSLTRAVCENLTARGINLKLYTNAGLWGYAGRDAWTAEATVNDMQDVLEILARAYGAVRCSAEALADCCARSEDPGTAFIFLAAEDSAESREIMDCLHEVSGLDVLPLFSEEVEA